MKLYLWAMLAAAGLLLVSCCCCPPHAWHSHGRTVVVPALAKPQVFAPDDISSVAAPRLLTRVRNPLPVVPCRQEGAYVCWATCAEMVMDFHGKRVRQCEQASRLGDAEGCCLEGEVRKECDAPNYPDFERWGFASTLQHPKSLTWEQAVAEIDDGRPFVFSRTKQSLKASGMAMSHMMVAVGYSQTGGPETRMLLCVNPRAFAVADEETISFEDYAGNSATTATGSIIVSDYIHESVYYNIQRALTTPVDP